MPNHINNDSDLNQVIIEIERQLNPVPGHWQPRIGTEAVALYGELPYESRQTILQEAVNILSRCIPPNNREGRETGLVIGYVQSGKTMSFTTVTALARDNNYRIVVLVAGTSKYLLDQSRQRLIRDLRLNSTSEKRPWRHISDPALDRDSHNIIRNILQDWNDPTVPPQELRTILITVMKQHRHLQNLINVLQGVELQGVPVLIIDDEGDQAGLNTQVRRGQQSTTYRRLLALKNAIPHHTFIQYTATPQAPLLINIVDILSPGFAEVITPGTGYVGGQDFFINVDNRVRIIPVNEIPTEANALNAPPPSLLEAMRLFFLGSSAHLNGQGLGPHRSMLVHPSRLTERHGQYLHWVRNALERWKNILQLPQDDQAYIDLMDLFRRSYMDLRETVTGIQAFELLVNRLLHVLRRTTVRVVNNSSREGKTPINWQENPYWILVGGQSMDRGFTVEGLIVTYMPRGTGVGNADTIQQRARFFGYKREYLGYCRIFLEQEVNDAFQSYIEHEEDIRSQLIEHRNTNRSLTEWRRQFFLTANLRPTRNNVIDIDYWRGHLGNRWIYPEGPHDAEEVIASNRSVFQQFTSTLDFAEHDGLDRRHTEHKNLVAHNISLGQVHDEFLTRISVRRLEDSQWFSLLLRQIQVHLNNNPGELCSIFLMSGGHPIRRSYENDKIKELFQGRQSDVRGMTYPGDRHIIDERVVSVQLRYLTLGERNQPIAENVPHLAVWIPDHIGRDFVNQPQGA